MRLKLIPTSLIFVTGLALSSTAVLANATSSCASMFAKAETMVANKGNIAAAKKVKGYQMAIDGYHSCSKALAMENGAERSTMMKKAEREFEAAYAFIRDVE